MEKLKELADIYLDLNVYISIAKREENYDYLIAKINNLHKAGVTFPHSPAHAEEVYSLKRSGRGNEIFFKIFKLIDKYNNNLAYKPGTLNEYEALQTYSIFRKLALHNPWFIEKAEMQLLIVQENRNGSIGEEDFKTQRICQKFEECLQIIDENTSADSFIKENETFHLGRRNENSLAENFSRIKTSTNGIKTFEEINKQLKLGPRLISEIPPTEIFLNEGLEEYAEICFKENDLDYKKIPSPEAFEKSHHKKEEYITVTMNLLEKAGYCQERKNHEASIIGRMHDVTHCIYATNANYFVTNDDRLRKKTIATYSKLGISTKVLNIEEFINLSI